MMRRLPSALACAPLVTAAIGSRTFSSDYSSNVGTMKPSHKFDSRSAAHRHPSRKTTWKSKDTPAPPPSSRIVDDDDDFADGADDVPLSESTATTTEVPRRVKSRYQSYFEPRSEPMTFTSTFASGALDDGAEKLEDAVTKIYSSDEVRQMAPKSSSHSAAARNAKQPNQSQSQSRASADDDGDIDDDGVAPADKGEGDAPDTFNVVREHPYFDELVRRSDANMVRYRKEVRAKGRYSRGVVDDCIRPLLQLVDYPFTPAKLAELVHSISPVVLRNSLKEMESCRKLHIYHSKDTDVVLDWTVEDFLRRRYEGIHVSWEPLEVIRKRYGWSSDVLTDRDCLVYLSRFTDFVELGELRVTNKGNLKAMPIDDPQALAQSGEEVPPSSRLLVRRVAQAETEPSVTETIRLMGTPAMERGGAGQRDGRPSHHQTTTSTSRRHSNPSTAADVFDSAEEAAADVDGDEATKLRHAASVVKPLRQASHPSGRVIKEFALGRLLTAEDTAATAAAQAAAAEETTDATATFDAASYEALSASYHKAKVESSVLRRQLLSTDNMEMIARLEGKLAGCRKEMRRLEGLLMSTIHEGHSQHTPITPEGTDDAGAAAATTASSSSAAGTSAAADADDGADVGFRLPKQPPRYMEAPEYDSVPTKNRYGAAEPDLDEEEIERAIQDYDAEVQGLQPRAAPKTTPVRAKTREVEQDADENEEEPAWWKTRPGTRTTQTAVDEEDAPTTATATAAQEADDDEADLAAPTAAEANDDAAEDDDDAHISASRVEETAEYQAMLREKHAHEERMAKMAAQLAAMEKRLADTAAAEKRAAEEKARREAEAAARAEKSRAELEARRERARMTELAARKAEEKRRQAEEEARALEMELEKKLAEVRAKLQRATATADADPVVDETIATADNDDDVIEAHNEDGDEQPPRATKTSASAEADEDIDDDDDSHQAPAEPAHHTKTASSPASVPRTSSPAPAPTPTTTTTTTNGFTCTPEQYDGLQLAATRLRREIATLEHQMEEEGDEDDETLMTVLAASRADLEELDECIHSVQANESWAAERDAARAAEEKRASQEEDTEFRRVQREVDQHRFNIDLLNRRIQHGTNRSTISKLEQRVVQARREVARLRITQDRLLRQGRDAFGLPKSVSMAKSLAGELKESEELAEEVQRAAAGLPPSKESTKHAADITTSQDIGDDDDAAAEAEADDMEAVDGHDAVAQSEPAAAVVPKIVQENPEMRQLRQRLDGILRSIQNVQEGLLRMRDAPAAYDEEEEEAALADMKDKLGQLLALRDDILSRLKESGVSASDATTSGAADGLEDDLDVTTQASGKPLPLLRSAAGARASADVLAAPTPQAPVNGGAQRTAFQSAHKKVHSNARMRRGRK